MGLLDIACDGCTQKFPIDTQISSGSPNKEHVRNIGGTFNGIFVCPTCWNSAISEGFKLELKEEAKRWKSDPKIVENKKIRVEEASRKKAVDNRQSKLEEASGQMLETLTAEMEKLFIDVLLPNERLIYKLRSAPSGDRSQAVLTNCNLIIINKGLLGGQGQDSDGILGMMMASGRISIRIYPVVEIRSVEIQPIQGMTVGHLQVLTNATMENDNESKFLFDTELGYYKSILMYRKIRQLQGFGVSSKAPSPNPLPTSKVPA
ncbi:hypothetical protein H6F75_18380 [Nodosilinea sp. FACHB-131]|uniref:hypothetical protein n=1 Tax=Cyanophyceae TaxID=3028117 RepID=UPI001686D94F|nr:hypothetical protein [Nodosilinea sp. FACHB-131]MBD1875452.1 hypothetical protein [Nodosilinea sp. FACHB-131]